ncbi:MAG: VOC family protein [Actinomycetota bacterium]|nr:VOC family protein [Actinomycetota bacterium]
MDITSGIPVLRQAVLDSTDPRALAEFYRQLLAYDYRLGDEAPQPGHPDPAADEWLVLHGHGGSPRLAFQYVPRLEPATWPDGEVPQQVHLDLTVSSKAELEAAHDRAIGLGARLLLDRSDDSDEPLRVYADVAGHPFCIFIPGATGG